MAHCPETWVPITDKPQMWWRIVRTYDGKPRCICAAVGGSADAAKTAFLESLADPHLALIEEISPIAFCEVTDVIEGLWGSLL
jgi:hypothetical protein